MSKDHERVDVVIAGAGIAGVSIAAKLALRGVSVRVLDMYDQYPYGATGRSAALFAKSYFSSPQFAMLTKGTQSAFENPTWASTDVPLVRDRGALYVAGDEDAVMLAKFCQELGRAAVDLPILYKRDVLEIVPILRDEKVIFGVYERDAKDMDVNAIFKAYERQARKNGCLIVPNAELLEAKWDGTAWTIRTASGTIEAEVLVNAAGAWGDVVASRCGVRRKNLKPLRRTAMIAHTAEQEGSTIPEMPFVFRAAENLYWCRRPEGYLISPSDATPSEPCDAQPEIDDIARALEAFEQMTTVKLAKRRPRAWAGLRTFATDKKPIVGYEASEARFFWLCGQGGYGIQTADAMSRLAAGLMLDGTVPMDLQSLGLREEDISPTRFNVHA